MGSEFQSAVARHGLSQPRLECQAKCTYVGLQHVEAATIGKIEELLWSTVILGVWSIVLDQPGALMLVASSVLWCIGGFAASNWLKGRGGQAELYRGTVMRQRTAPVMLPI
jgi:hypothetical protein